MPLSLLSHTLIVNELALAEGPSQLPASVDDRQGGHVGLDELRDRVAGGLVVAQQQVSRRTVMAIV
jgi:hypothetical protein